MSDSAALPNRSFRRAVFYIAGFDNIGPRFYYGLFRSGLAHEFGRVKRAFKLSRAEPVSDDASRWRVETDDGGRPVTVDYFFLTPQDVVRDYSQPGVRRILSAWLYTFAVYFGRGLVFRGLAKTWKAIVLLITLLWFPAFFAAGAAAAWGLASILDFALPPLAVGGIALAAGSAMLWFGIRAAEKTYVNLVLLALFTGALHARGRLPQLERRTQDWTRFIRERAAAEEWDEVLLVGHSSGVVTAVDVAADLVREPPRGRKLPLALLTLGSIDGSVSAFRGREYEFARRHREAVVAVATSPDIVWVEYWSPWDFICIGPHDALSVSDIDLGDRARHGPKLREVDLWRTLSPESYRRMFFNLFARHFQYLRGLDLPGDYSYFRIVAAARRLA